MPCQSSRHTMTRNRLSTHLPHRACRLSALLLVLVFVSHVCAQEVTEAEYPYKRDIMKGRYERAESKILRRLDRDSNNLECHYAAFILYSSPSFDSHNVDKAYSHLVTVRNLFRTAEQKHIDRWTRDSYSGALFDHDLRRVCSQAMNRARGLNTLDAYQHFLDNFTHAYPDQRDSIINSRDSLEFSQIKSMGTFDMLQNFILRNPHSVMYNDAIQLRDSIAFCQTNSQHTTAAYTLFCKTYPDSHLLPRATDSIYHIEYRQALHLDAEQYYRGYSDRYPFSPFASHCTWLADSIEYYRVIDTSQWQSYADYLDSHNNSTSWTSRAIQRLALLAIRHGNLQALQQASIRMNPDDTLYTAVAHSLHHAYLHTSVRNYHRFYTLFPHLVPDSIRIHDSIALNLYNNYHYHIIDSCIRTLVPCHEAYIMLQQLLKDDIYHHRWNTAISTATRYSQPFGNDYDYRCLLATLRAESSSQTKPTILPPAINSQKGDEYAPVITADGKTLFFAGKYRPDNIGGEDVFVSHRKGRKWDDAVIEMDLSHTYGNEAPVSVTTDGTTLLLFQSGILFQADKTSNGWNIHRLPPHINNNTWQADATIASNGRLLLWAAKGTTDRHADTSVNIYASVLDSNGHWGTPFELGPAINTPFDERSPMLHPDMHTLYFCSEGHGSLGQMDLFVSRRLCDTSWTQWSQPVNAGKLFNTTDDDWGYKITTDGTQAYYAKPGRSQDIFTTTLPQTARPMPVTALCGTVRDRAGRPVSTQLQWEDLNSGMSLGQCRTDPATGRYFILVPQGTEYGYYIHDSLYFPHSAHADLTARSNPDSIHVDFTLTSYVQMTDDGISETLNNVFFDAANWQFNRRSEAELKRIAHIVKQRHLNVEISSHVDGTNDESNTNLTQRRADELRQYLIGLGCRPSTIKAMGMGSSRPLYRKNSLHRDNRRIEIRLAR